MLRAIGNRFKGFITHSDDHQKSERKKAVMKTVEKTASLENFLRQSPANIIFFYNSKEDLSGFLKESNFALDPETFETLVKQCKSTAAVESLVQLDSAAKEISTSNLDAFGLRYSADKIVRSFVTLQSLEAIAANKLEEEKLPFEGKLLSNEELFSSLSDTDRCILKGSMER